VVTRTIDRLREWVAALPAVVLDIGLALGLIPVSLYSIWLSQLDSSQRTVISFSPMAVAVIVATALPVALRRRFPVIVLVVVALATVGQFALLAPLSAARSSWGLLVALYTVAAYCTRRTSLMALGLVVGLSYLQVVMHPERPSPMGFWLGIPVVYGGMWLLGDWIKTRRAYTAELEQRAARLIREREQQAQLALAQERVRIARELHDVIAHHISVMGIQAAAARRIFDHRREDALAALTAIETASRQAIGELHQLVGLLRRSDKTDEPDVAPQPGLAQLPALIAEIREASLHVELIIEGEQRALPPSVELSAYRIIQEALTNTLKHAGAAHAWVRLRYTSTGVELEVLDDGTGPPPIPRPGGNGLVGMRERVALHGGHLETGARPNGGFRVYATLDGQRR
jgi:signal transduction histidine kinase